MKSVNNLVVSDHSYHALVSCLYKSLFIGYVPFHPAVGDHVTGNGGVVDCQGAFPADHQGRLIQRLDLHAHWSTAAHWSRMNGEIWKDGRVKRSSKKNEDKKNQKVMNKNKHYYKTVTESFKKAVSSWLFQHIKPLTRKKYFEI